MAVRARIRIRWGGAIRRRESDVRGIVPPPNALPAHLAAVRSTTTLTDDRGWWRTTTGIA